MQPAVFRIAVLVLAAAPYLYPQSTPANESHGVEAQGIPVRATPGDYQAHTKAGAVTLAAEFDGHFVPTEQGTLTTEEYVVVEAALFGDPGARLKLSPDDFSLRINGKKSALPSESYVMVSKSLKDPEWVPPDSDASAKSKTSILSGGGSAAKDQSNAPPPPVHVPIELQRAMAQHTQKAALAEGDRALPQGGLIFFPYRGKAKDIRSVELIYKGPAGEASLELQP